MPDAFIGIDVIVGFPGETEADFRTTCDFLAGARTGLPPYFPLLGAVPVRRPSTCPARCRRRWPTAPRGPARSAVRDRLHARISAARAVGHRVGPCCFESTMRGGMMFGFTGNYRRVKAPYDKARVNTVCRVRLGAMDESHDLMGEIRD